MLQQLVLIGALTLSPMLSSAQPAGRARSFEAASVKVSTSASRYNITGGPGTSDPGQIAFSNVSLHDLILRAYDLRAYQVKGAPSWFESEHFDIVAKLPRDSTREDLNVMLQALLSDRFSLSVRRETQPGQTYDLTVDKKGPKLTEAVTANSVDTGTVGLDANGMLQTGGTLIGKKATAAGRNIVPLISNGKVLVLAKSQTLSALAETLSKFMGGPVHDSTGLTKPYDFTLSFELPPGYKAAQRGPSGECTACVSNDSTPIATVFQALGDLGLRLDEHRGPIEVIIIDHVERVPTAN